MLALIKGEKLYKNEYEGILSCYNEGFDNEYVSYEDFKQYGADYYFVYLREDKEIVATAMGILKYSLLHDKPSMRIENVVVKERYRGNRFGYTVVNRLVELAKDKGCYKVDLSCSNKNVVFYERLGFRLHENTMRLDYDN